ncbi:Serine/threonine-protein kinase csk1 [Golovinomyces cichoracearum]|uniref:cyclin-dependent kinase n=1 Tax=Golovinomyces cichoracearum TaxID=62708 RepID=A0A420IX63_9PEZI|nr:Serine/threonine-protein kinase csk1 [Golovinomyces cichoracearum]
MASHPEPGPQTQLMRHHVRNGFWTIYEKKDMWRSNISFVERWANIRKIKKSLETISPENPEAKAIQVEKEAFNRSDSRESYDTACQASSREQSHIETIANTSEPKSPGILIGKYDNCHLLSSGFCSDVYRCGVLALKVTTRTHNIEPHNPKLEIKILTTLSHPSIIRLVTSFNDSNGFPVLVFPYQPLTLGGVLSTKTLTTRLVASIFYDIFSGLTYLHEQEIIHRDLKPSNILLTSPEGPALLADFGTAWHPVLSLPLEPVSQKYIEVGTTAYRAPETLFGNHAYGTSLDLWPCGTILAECLRVPTQPLFESREACEDGNQLGLILSMFKTLGTPTEESWPEASGFTTPPFEWYNKFEGKEWNVILEGVDDFGIDLVSKLVVWESKLRLTAAKVCAVPESKPYDLLLILNLNY